MQLACPATFHFGTNTACRSWSPGLVFASPSTIEIPGAYRNWLGPSPPASIMDQFVSKRYARETSAYGPFSLVQLCSEAYAGTTGPTGSHSTPERGPSLGWWLFTTSVSPELGQYGTVRGYCISWSGAVTPIGGSRDTLFWIGGKHCRTLIGPVR
jgi:hypothetical protein